MTVLPEMIICYGFIAIVRTSGFKTIEGRAQTRFARGKNVNIKIRPVSHVYCQYLTVYHFSELALNINFSPNFCSSVDLSSICDVIRIVLCVYPSQGS